jgi:hypothetical protein
MRFVYADLLLPVFAQGVWGGRRLNGCGENVDVLHNVDREGYDQEADGDDEQDCGDGTNGHSILLLLCIS